MLEIKLRIKNTISKKYIRSIQPFFFCENWSCFGSGKFWEMKKIPNLSEKYKMSTAVQKLKMCPLDIIPKT